MSISAAQLARYKDEGFLVIEGFVNKDSCDRLRARANELVQEFDPAEVMSIFTTREQNRVADD